MTRNSMKQMLYHWITCRLSYFLKNTQPGNQLQLVNNQQLHTVVSNKQLELTQQEQLAYTYSQISLYKTTQHLDTQLALL